MIEAFTIPLRFSWVEMVQASVLVMVDEATNTIASNFETKMKFARIFMENREDPARWTNVSLSHSR